MRKEELSRCDRRRLSTAAAARGEGVDATDGGARASSMVKGLGGLELGLGPGRAARLAAGVRRCRRRWERLDEKRGRKKKDREGPRQSIAGYLSFYHYIATTYIIFL